MTEFFIFITNTVQRKLLIFGTHAFPKENIYIKVNFIMFSFKVKIIMGSDFGPKGYIKGDKYALICL